MRAIKPIFGGFILNYKITHLLNCFYRRSKKNPHPHQIKILLTMLHKSAKKLKIMLLISDKNQPQTLQDYPQQEKVFQLQMNLKVPQENNLLQLELKMLLKIEELIVNYYSQPQGQKNTFQELSCSQKQLTNRPLITFNLLIFLPKEAFYPGSRLTKVWVSYQEPKTKTLQRDSIVWMP